jgi:DNA polymerase I-like protein with 3'-5' exonuclease and polymerase domains
MTSVYGWKLNLIKATNDRTLANFPMQANGAEMLRVAIMLAIDAGVKVCAPIHDAILIEAPIEDIERAVSATQESMRNASRAVLDGFELRSDVEIIRYPERYSDPRGQQLWGELLTILDDLV